MMMFSEQFSQQHSFEIMHNGKKINAFFRYDKKGIYRLRFDFLSTASPYRQAVVLHLSEFHGRIFMDGKEIAIAKKKRFPQIVFSEADSINAPNYIEMTIELQDGDIAICNGSEHPEIEGLWTTLYGGCAMIIEQLDTLHYRFYCNDRENDDDFDDLIFELSITPANEQ